MDLVAALEKAKPLIARSPEEYLSQLQIAATELKEWQRSLNSLGWTHGDTAEAFLRRLRLQGRSVADREAHNLVVGGSIPPPAPNL